MSSLHLLELWLQEFSQMGVWASKPPLVNLALLCQTLAFSSEFGPVNLIADWTHQLTTQSDDVLARAGGLHGEPRPRPTPGPRTL